MPSIMKSDEIPQVGTVELQLPTLGNIKGLSYNNETCQFRRSVSAAPWKNGEHDGTKLGPYCPQPPRDFYPIPSAARPWLEMPAADEFNCLNLNISVPRLPFEDGIPLPIMVFLHGGAFAYAMGLSPIYDGRILANASANVLSRPTIIITLNYRPGVYGFLAGVGNYSIWDQVLALRRAQKHIAGFGGDPKQVTLFGQSAGGVSVHCHLLRDEPPFSSAILQSGLIRLCGVFSIDEYQVVYENILRELGISLDLSSSERIKKLLRIDEKKKLTDAMAPTFIVPVVTMALCDDKILIPGGIQTSAEYNQFKVPEWCPRIMLGDCINECIIWNKSWDNLSPVPMTKAQALATPTAPLLLKKMQSFLGAEKSKTIADIGMAHHSFDNVFIWSVLKHTLPPQHRRIGEVMVAAWIKFDERKR
ncbi:alpha/beta-hydrolase [Acephala macrosclerotiorum]|nr:alpha/beta-hydrolase [Acephala macrosclerotiorum]